MHYKNHIVLASILFLNSYVNGVIYKNRRHKSGRLQKLGVKDRIEE